MEKETFQEFCARTLPVVIAGADGETTLVKSAVGWLTHGNLSDFSFRSGMEYQVKPKTHIVNGFEVPFGDAEFELHEKCFYPALDLEDIVDWHRFSDDSFDRLIISRGIAFKTKEAAIANAKAMLGIDPYGEDAE